jgi:hypothetical protein
VYKLLGGDVRWFHAPHGKCDGLPTATIVAISERESQRSAPWYVVADFLPDEVERGLQKHVINSSFHLPDISSQN